MISSLWMRFVDVLFSVLVDQYVIKRPPDFIIGQHSSEGAYLNRWYITPWRGWYRDVPEAQRTRWMRFAIGVSRCLPSLYLHEFLRDDDDRAHHDHPAWSFSLMLAGDYIEHTIAAGGINRRELISTGALRFRRASHAHRIELQKRAVATPNGPNPYRVITRRCWTLFMFGPVILGRGWGFHCPEQGFIPWQRFTAAGKPGETGPGCEG